jgi:hypothetical protein
MAGFAHPQSFQNAPDALAMDFVKAAYPTVLKQEGEFATICQTKQKYMCAEMLNASEEETDLKFTWPVMVNQGVGGRHGLLGEEDSIAVSDVMRYANGNMVHFSENVAWEQREILAAQNNPKKMFTLLKARRASVQLASLDTLEAALWSAPTSAEEAETAPMGIPFWIQKDSGASGNGEFTGGDPSGFTGGAGGLASATYTNWQNWVGVYAAVTDDDLGAKLQSAFLHLKFLAPTGYLGRDIQQPSGDKIKICVNEATYTAIKKMVKDQNDSVGFDIDPVDNGARFQRRAFDWIPYLDADTSNPIYLIDQAVLKAHHLKGDKFRETGPDKVAGRHNTIAVFVDLSYQYVATNRKRLGIIHKA